MRRGRIGARALSAFAVVVTTGALGGPARAQTIDFECSDFAVQEDAQSALDSGRATRARLDPDGDGVACESLARRSGAPAGAEATRARRAVSRPGAVRTTRVVARAASARRLARTGPDAPLLPPAAVLLASGVAAIAISRARRKGAPGPWDVLPKSRGL